MDDANPQKTIVVDGNVFLLEDVVDTDALEQDVLDAARAGVGFVSIPSAERGLVRVLITSISAVSIALQARDVYWAPCPLTSDYDC